MRQSVRRHLAEAFAEPACPSSDLPLAPGFWRS